MYIGKSVNDYGTTVSSFKCETCDQIFTVCPEVEPERHDSWKDCLADECGSYDPDRDADVLFMSRNEIAEKKKVISIQKLRQRKQVQRAE